MGKRMKKLASLREEQPISLGMLIRQSVRATVEQVVREELFVRGLTRLSVPTTPVASVGWIGPSC